MKSFFLAVNLLSLFCMALPVKEALQKAKEFFQKDRCPDAIKVLKDINPQIDLESTDDIIEIYKIKTICYFDEKDIEKAKNAIKEIYLIDPNFEFDAFSTPKEIIDLANKEKIFINNKSRDLIEIKNQILAPPKEKINPIVNFLPFGLNHYWYGQNLKGALYLSLESGFLLSNIAFFWAKQSYIMGFGGALRDQKDQQKFNTLQGLQIVSIFGAVLAFGISVLDALIWGQNAATSY